MKMWWFCVVLYALLLAAVDAHAQAFKGNPEKGRAVYESHCLRCHGKDLDGKGPEAASLSVPPENFRALYSRAKTESELRMTIRRGRSLTAMHRWEDELREVQISDVLAYIRSVIPQEQP
jgi:mono/diheme cytochrome c family protein